MKVFNPFGPKIAITKIPKKIINKKILKKNGTLLIHRD